MKFKSQMVVNQLGDEFVAVPVGENAEHLIVKLNKTGADIFKDLYDGLDEEQIVRKLLKQYDIDREKAERAVKSVAAKLSAEGLIEE